MQKKYIVRLSKRERELLGEVVKKFQGTKPKGSSRPSVAQGRRGVDWRMKISDARYKTQIRLSQNEAVTQH